MRVLDFSDGYESSTAPSLTDLTAAGLRVYVDDAAFVTAKGSAAAEGDMYWNSTSDQPKYYTGAAWIFGVTTAGTQTIAGAKTFSNDVTITGNLTVNGTTTTFNSTTVDSVDPNITVNKGGSVATANSSVAGITVEASGGSTGRFGYDSTLASKFKLGVSGSEVEVLTASHSQVVTNKDIDGGTASNTNRITVPKDTTTNINALTRKAGTIVYDTTTSTFKGDDGSALVEFAAGSGISPSEVFVDTGNGYGSTNTKVRRWSNIRKNVGSDITYADSAANGGSFTINTTGVYSITTSDAGSGGACQMAITVNDSSLGTSPSGMTYAQGLRAYANPPNQDSISITLNLDATDVIRWKGDTTPMISTDRAMMSVTRIT